MRIGIYGGSFDPIHTGHLILAEQCRTQANLDQIWFVPCATNPHKPDGPIAKNRQRKEMIQLAISGHEPFQFSSIELDRGDVSYTIDTLMTFSETYPDDELFLLMGSDSLEEFENWKDPAKICELAVPLIINRPGAKPVDLGVVQSMVDEERFKQIKTSQMTSFLIEISSSEIRKRVRNGETIRYLLPRGVERYLQTQKLYLPLEKA